MKLKQSRIAAMASALGLLATGVVGLQPATAAPTSPSWDSGAVNGGIPVVTIANDTATVVSIPAPIRTGGLQGGFKVVYACNQPIDAGFYSWSAPVGQPLYPPSGTVDGASCVQLAINVSDGSTVNLLTASTDGAGPTYNPATHGTNIVAGWRDTDNNESLGVPQDDLFWVSVGNSVVYTPPAPPTVSSQPTLSLTGTAISFTGAVFSGGSGVTGNQIYSCPAAVSAVTIPTAQSSLGLSGCQVLRTSAMNSAPPTDLSTAFVFAVINGTPGYVAYDGSRDGTHIVGYSSKSNVAVITASAQVGGSSSPEVVASPYTGPVVQAPGAIKPVAGGSKLVLDGSNLTGVSKVTIDGKDASGKVNPDGKLEITVPKGLAEGTYDLVITSDSGLLTVQDAIRVSGSAVSGEEPTPSTKLKEDDTVKVYVFNVVGAGKVQIMHNGKEVAWVDTNDPGDAKILNDYLVRTLDLLNGKNIIEIFVDGKRIDRKAYTKVDDDSKI